MRFTFLGTGTSAGIPAIGCDCAVCRSADPRDRRLRTSAAIRFADPAGQDRCIALDCGPDFRQQALRARLERLDAILFTHNHVDHTFGLDEVRRYNAMQRGPLDVYASAHTLEHLRRVYKHIFERAQNVNESFVAWLIAHQIEPGRPLELFGLRIDPLGLLHGRLPILGYRVDADPPLAQSPPGLLPLAYCTDVSGVAPETWPRLAGVRTLVLDALRHRRHPTHLTVAQAVDIARRIGAKRTWLVHMSHDLAHEATNRSLPPDIQLAFDGLELDAAGDPAGGPFGDAA